MSLVEKVKDAASPVIGMAGPVVMQALEKATPLVDMALEKANPYIEQAKEVATPYVEVAREMTAPLLESTINKVGPFAEKVSVTAGPIVDPKAKLRGFRPKTGEAYGRIEARTGIEATFSSSRCDQMMPFGLRRSEPRVRMTSSGVTMRSTRKSCSVSGRSSSRTWRSWTVVTMTVRSSISPASVSNPNSRSE